MELLELGVAGQLELAAEPHQQMAPPIAEVEDPRREPFGVQRDPQAVDRRNQQLVGDPLEQRAESAVGHLHVPVAIDRERRIGLVAGEQLAECVTNAGQLGVVE